MDVKSESQVKVKVHYCPLEGVYMMVHIACKTIEPMVTQNCINWGQYKRDLWNSGKQDQPGQWLSQCVQQENAHREHSPEGQQSNTGPVDIINLWKPFCMTAWELIVAKGALRTMIQWCIPKLHPASQQPVQSIFGICGFLLCWVEEYDQLQWLFTCSYGSTKLERISSGGSGGCVQCKGTHAHMCHVSGKWRRKSCQQSGYPGYRQAEEAVVVRGIGD